MTLSNDTPINGPGDDLFGLDAFAKALAKNIEAMAAPEGIVLSINGPWGSGKSSALNLMKHHLAPAVNDGRLELVTFNPWWFAGADALTLAFFQELNTAIGPSLPEKARKAFSAIGGGISSVGQIIGAAVNMKVPGLGPVLSSATRFVGDRAKNKRTVEQEHQILVDALKEQSKRFLVIIDDIDRLNPDDALNIFRLVKSVGRLPNVIYLLAFDRVLAERAVAERFPSEGPSYLEKIVQTSFEVPPPLVDELRNQLLNSVIDIMGQPADVDMVRFMNLFYDVVAPLLNTPRDMVRLTNDIAATFPAVVGNVDRADFLALSTIRLFEPKIYQAIRDNGGALCGLQSMNGSRSDELSQNYLQMLRLDELSPKESQRWQRSLKRLFPRLEGIWSNTFYQDDNEWQRQRLLCTTEHFRTYFAYAISDDILPAEEIDQLINRADDIAYVQEYLRQNLTRQRRNGTTRASLVLEELTVRAADIGENKVQNLVSAIFSLGDELNVEADVGRGFNTSSNPLRIYWLCNRLVTDRFDEARRDVIYETAAASAPVGWLCDFAESCYRRFQPGNQSAQPPRVSQAVAERLRTLSSEKLREAAENGSLATSPRLRDLLFIWRDLPNGIAEARQWTDQQLANDTFVVAIAKVLTAESWSQGMGMGDGSGDLVARRNIYVNEEPYREMLDVDRLNLRVTELLEDHHNGLSPETRQIIAIYDLAPRRRP